MCQKAKPCGNASNVKPLRRSDLLNALWPTRIAQILFMAPEILISRHLFQGIILSQILFTLFSYFHLFSAFPDFTNCHPCWFPLWRCFNVPQWSCTFMSLSCVSNKQERDLQINIGGQNPQGGPPLLGWIMKLVGKYWELIISSNITGAFCFGDTCINQSSAPFHLLRTLASVGPTQPLVWA